MISMPLIGDLADSFHFDTTAFEKGLHEATELTRRLVDQVEVASRPPCPRCNKPCGVVGTTISNDYRTRYLGCRACGYRHQQPEIVPIAQAPKQAGPGRPRATSSSSADR